MHPIGTIPNGVFFCLFGGKWGLSKPSNPDFSNHHRTPNMNPTVKSYLYFLAFMVVTKVVITPIVKPMNIPILSAAL